MERSPSPMDQQQQQQQGAPGAPAAIPAGIPDWQVVEDGFWKRLQASYEEEDKMLNEEYRKTKAAIQVTLGEIYHERSALADRMRSIEALCATEEARMEALNTHYDDHRRVRFSMRDSTVTQMRQWFATNRGAAVATMPSAATTPATPARPPGMNVGAPLSARSASLPSVVTKDLTGVEICDIAGSVLGPLYKIRTRNPAIDAIGEGLAIRRRVKVRPNRKYGSHNLSTLYEPTDAKGGKWIACMIQATGELEEQKCAICQKGQGPFEDCVMLIDREGFSKCGNCEWSRQGCHGSTHDPNPTAQPPLSSGSDAAAAAADLAARQYAQSIAIAARPPASAGPATPLAAGPLPTSQVMVHRYGSNGAQVAPINTNPFMRQHHMGPGAASSSPVVPGPNPMAFTRPAPASAGLPSLPQFPPNAPGRYLGGPSNVPPSVGDDDGSEEAEEVELDPITPGNLVVKHDGVYYTEPECLRGVPVAKIDPSHPYWDPSWENIEDLIRPQYEKWLGKQEATQKTGGVVQHAKFQIGRQVNRGARTLEFLRTGKISPYQLLCKKYMPSGKGGIISYDTLFRLANTLEELSQFKQDVEPLDWLRHRLHEILLVQGDKFNLSRTMHEFYHDPKLSALRKKSGFSQIGRPSRVRHRNSTGGTGGADPSGPPAKRRKNVDSPRGIVSPAVAGGAWRGPPMVSALPSYTQSPAMLGSRGGDPSGLDMMEDDDGGVTDTDSYCGEAIESTDFRVYQVKHRTMATNPAMSQYWHWLDDEDERSLQHQVLKDTNPTQWGMYREPLNFSVNLDEVVEVLWAPSTQRIIVAMNAAAMDEDGAPRGDVLVHFKRERTLRRFCRHMEAMGVVVGRTSLEVIEDRWDRIKCPQLPPNDEDDNIEV